MEFFSFIDEYQKVVERYPSHTAVEMGKRSYTHLEMWNRASSIADSLSDLPKNSRVGLRIPKSFDLVASILGCWMRGLIFIPLDPSLPSKRIEEYINDVQPHRILSVHTSPIRQQLPTNSLVSVHRKQLSAEDGAYIIYSSGSTGRPKGILVSHRGLVPVISQQIATLGLTPEDRCLWFLSIQFDASISDIGVALLSGSALIIEPQKSFLEALHHHRISYVDMPPVLLGIYKPEQFPKSLLRILIGGEPCPYRALETHRKHRPIIVVYGPTESTICTSLVVCDAQNSCKKNSIGMPLEGVEYHIEQGELWIAGEMLALGYWNRPSMNHKWVMRDQKRFFRTGDAVTYSNGEYLFLGRIDRQCKLHGKLIAPEEIEQAFCMQDDIQRAYVCVHQHQLFAFIESASLAQYSTYIPPLSRRLPRWMIPNHGMVLATLPTLPSGKIDSNTLKTYISTPNSSHLWCSLFSQVLHKPVQIHDNFFKLGGDSIALMALLVLAQKHNQQITPERLRLNPTPHLLSKMCSIASGRTVAELKRYVDKESALLPQSTHHTSTHDIYITGVTGFLGSKILSILCAKGFRPRVLVRGNSIEHAIQRIPTSYRDKVEVFVGDLTDKKSIIPFVGRGEGLLFHCAASLSLGKSLNSLYPVNVQACSQLFSYPNLKIAYASTLAFLLSHNGQRGRIIEKESSLAMDTRIFGGYAQSKWIAEQLAVHRQALIFRFGLLVDTTTLPRFDWFVSFVRGLAKLGCIPRGLDDSVCLDMTPISYAAHAFVDIALKESHGIYHIASSKSVSLRLLCMSLVSLGYSIGEYEKDEWFHQIDRLETNHELHVVRLAFQAALNDTTHTPQLNMFLATDALFDDTQVQRSIGRQAPVPTLAFVRSVVQHIMENT